MIRANELAVDLDVYPRSEVDEDNVDRLTDALRANAKLPPLIIESSTKRIVDGVHRWHANMAVYGDSVEIPCIEKSYRDDADLFLDAVRLNAVHGATLSHFDRQTCVAIAGRLTITDDLIAGALSMSTHRLGLLRIVGAQQPDEDPAPLTVPARDAGPAHRKQKNRNYATSVVAEPAAPKPGEMRRRNQAWEEEMEIVERGSTTDPESLINSLIVLIEQDCVDFTDATLKRRIAKLHLLLERAFI